MHKIQTRSSKISELEKKIALQIRVIREKDEEILKLRESKKNNEISSGKTLIQHRSTMRQQDEKIYEQKQLLSSYKQENSRLHQLVSDLRKTIDVHIDCNDKCKATAKAHREYIDKISKENIILKAKYRHVIDNLRPMAVRFATAIQNRGFDSGEAIITQYDMLVNENVNLKNQLDEAKKTIEQKATEALVCLSEHTSDTESEEGSEEVLRFENNPPMTNENVKTLAAKTINSFRDRSLTWYWNTIKAKIGVDAIDAEPFWETYALMLAQYFAVSWDKGEAWDNILIRLTDAVFKEFGAKDTPKKTVMKLDVPPAPKKNKRKHTDLGVNPSTNANTCEHARIIETTRYGYIMKCTKEGCSYNKHVNGAINV